MQAAANGSRRLFLKPEHQQPSALSNCRAYNKIASLSEQTQARLHFYPAAIMHKACYAPGSE